MAVDRRWTDRPAVTWVRVSLVAGAVIAVVWSVLGWEGLNARLVRDGGTLLVGSLAVAVAYGRRPADLGWTVDRRALRDTVVLAAFVLPFYLVGSSLPSVRAFYPMWETTVAPASFVPHALKQLFLVVAAETFYRGLLCVGISSVGPASVFVSPVVYAVHHAQKPPIELLLSAPTDVLFGAVDYHAGSILPSVVAHGLGLVLLDWLVLHDPLFPPERVVGWFEWLPVAV